MLYLLRLLALGPWLLFRSFDVLYEAKVAKCSPIFRFMGWTGSLVVLVVSIGLPEQGATNCFRLRCHLFFPCLWSGSHDGEENDGIGTSWFEVRKTRKFGPWRMSQVFYRYGSLVHLHESSGSRCRASVWLIEWTMPATLNIIPSRKIPFMLGIQRLPSIKKVIVSAVSALLLTWDVLSGINENRPM